MQHHQIRLKQHISVAKIYAILGHVTYHFWYVLILVKMETCQVTFMSDDSFERKYGNAFGKSLCVLTPNTLPTC